MKMAISGNCNVSRPFACLKVTMGIVITLLCFFGMNTLASYGDDKYDIPNCQQNAEFCKLAEFALKKQKTYGELSLVRVVRACTDYIVVQGVPESLYFLIMEAHHAHGTTRSYSATVKKLSRTDFKLKDFKLKHHPTDESQASLWNAVRVQDPMVKEAAVNAVKIIQQRSNSLMSYELQEIVSAKGKVVNALNIFDLLLKIKWENEVKNYEVEMKRTLEGKWTMN
jgi:hypothetical protein